MAKIDWNAAAALLMRHNSFVLTTHVSPDGDGLGTEIALGLGLQRIGKNVRIVNYSETPENYMFLNAPSLQFERFDPAAHAAAIAAADAIVIVDMNDRARLRTMQEPVLNSPAVKIILDHHTDPERFAGEYIIDDDACASGEIAFGILDVILRGAFTKEIATALYAAIMTDTGSFRFPRTDAGVHRIVARLLDSGADPVAIYESIYNQRSLSRQRLYGAALGALRLEHGGALAVITVAQAMLVQAQAHEEDTEEFVQATLAIRGVKMGIFALELRDGVKLSFRSKGEAHVHELATHFGGGGHLHAAGARVRGGALSDVVEEAVREAKEYL